jgi:hypothetical protein
VLGGSDMIAAEREEVVDLVEGCRREPASLANTRIDFAFTGRAAHAAAAPHLGRSALDAVELMNVGVSVHPGIMPPMRTSGRTADPAIRVERMRTIPMRRPGEVDEVAYAILFLAPDESSYITGSEIHVDGGVLAI